MQDRLDQLLRAVDDPAPPPAPADELVRRIYARRERQRRMKRSVVATAAVICVTLAVLPARLRHEHVVIMPPPPRPPTVVAVTANPALLDLEAQLHEQVADRLLAARRNDRKLSLKPAGHDPALAELQQQRDRAALLLVYEADQYRRRNLAGEAVASYRRAIELFPQSHWADVARQRLKDL